MKNIFCLAFILFGFLAGAQGQINQKDAQGRNHGLWKKNHPNGKLRYIGNFDHGKEVGPFTILMATWYRAKHLKMM